MITGTTSTGFKYTVDERILSDWRLIDAVADSESNDDLTKVKGTKKLVDMILGADQQKMINHIASLNSGFCPASAMMKEINEIMTEAKTKNLSSSPTA